MRALEEAARGEDRASQIHARIEALDDATKAFAGRRMNRAIARAIAGKRVDVDREERRARKGHRAPRSQLDAQAISVPESR